MIKPWEWGSWFCKRSAHNDVVMRMDGETGNFFLPGSKQAVEKRWLDPKAVFLADLLNPSCHRGTEKRTKPSREGDSIYSMFRLSTRTSYVKKYEIEKIRFYTLIGIMWHSFFSLLVQLILIEWGLDEGTRE